MFIAKSPSLFVLFRCLSLEVEDKKMAFRFCANLNFMFCENSPSILDKFRLARAAGFRGVEIPCPDTVDVQTVENARKENELEVALMNISLGNLSRFLIIFLSKICKNSTIISLVWFVNNEFRNFIFDEVYLICVSDRVALNTKNINE